MSRNELAAAIHFALFVPRYLDALTVGHIRMAGLDAWRELPNG